MAYLEPPGFSADPQRTRNASDPQALLCGTGSLKEEQPAFHSLMAGFMGSFRVLLCIGVVVPEQSVSHIFPLWSIAPFILMLLSIATAPLITPTWWDKKAINSS